MRRIRENTYEIANPTGVCAATRATIRPGEPFIAVLFEGDGEVRLQRRDYSLAGWESGAGRVEGVGSARVLGSWRGVMPEPNAPRRRFIDDDALVEMFEQLGGEQTDAGRAAFRYVLALVLVRKRLLRVESSRPGLMLVRWPGVDPELPAMEVKDPGMDDRAAAEVVEQLSAVIRGPAGAGA
jgi:hypothetical protein